jgi:hypothetical protein
MKQLLFLSSTQYLICFLGFKKTPDRSCSERLTEEREIGGSASLRMASQLCGDFTVEAFIGKVVTGGASFCTGIKYFESWFLNILFGNNSEQCFLLINQYDVFIFDKFVILISTQQENETEIDQRVNNNHQI